MSSAKKPTERYKYKNSKQASKKKKQSTMEPKLYSYAPKKTKINISDLRYWVM